ncbi:NADH-quinone oxidoreductase subunit K [Marispirochaeta aestuarii]|uniref:NADH-quinone oxidoreductase subunit K n=1 Tax=Marispirochaeta aestuarii TaxID=1963862 RepID=UPI0029C8871A|nr:NADH-quinone oxidoreductase subunit K [Marispirochaeta aestuarii]
MSTQLLTLLALLLMGIGVFGLLSRRHIMKIIVSFSLLDTGIHILLVAVGYRSQGTAPIFDADLTVREGLARGGGSGSFRSGPYGHSYRTGCYGADAQFRR